MISNVLGSAICSFLTHRIKIILAVVLIILYLTPLFLINSSVNATNTKTSQTLAKIEQTTAIVVQQLNAQQRAIQNYNNTVVALQKNQGLSGRALVDFNKRLKSASPSEYEKIYNTQMDCATAIVNREKNDVTSCNN